MAGCCLHLAGYACGPLYVAKQLSLPDCQPISDDSLVQYRPLHSATAVLERQLFYVKLRHKEFVPSLPCPPTTNRGYYITILPILLLGNYSAG